MLLIDLHFNFDCFSDNLHPIVGLDYKIKLDLALQAIFSRIWSKVPI